MVTVSSVGVAGLRLGQLPVVELVVALVGGWNDREREGRERTRCRKEKEKNRGVWLVFCQIWTRFYPPSGHQIRLYLQAVEEGNLVYIGVKFHPFIQLVRISTVGSKQAWCTIKSAEKGCLGWHVYFSLDAIKTEMFTWSCRGTAVDHFRARFVKFGGRQVH